MYQLMYSISQRTDVLCVYIALRCVGFIGGLFMTLLCGFLLPILLSKYQYMTCPKSDFSLQWPTCTAQYPFIQQNYNLPVIIPSILHTLGFNSFHSISLLPIQLHGLVLGAFASLIGPFGGFFASGFKRAFGTFN